MPSCIHLNSSSEESFHFLVQITMGGCNNLTSFFFLLQYAPEKNGY